MTTSSGETPTVNKPSFQSKLTDLLTKGLAFARTHRASVAVVGIVLVLVIIDYSMRTTAKPESDYFAQGLQQMRNNQADEAIQNFSKALLRNPADPAARYGLGWGYQEKGWDDEAVKQYEMSTAAGIEYIGQAYYNLGVIPQKKKKMQEAEDAFMTAVLLRPKSVPYLYGLGLLYAERGKYEQALAQFLKATQLDPRNVLSFHHAGLMCEKLNRKPDAKKYYSTAVSIDPNFSAAKDRLSVLGK